MTDPIVTNPKIPIEPAIKAPDLPSKAAKMHFLDMPVEIRNMIYIAACNQSAIIINLGPRSPGIHRLGKSVSLLSCNKQIKEEASEFILKNTALRIKGWLPTSQRNALILTIPKIWRASITNLHSSVYLDEALAEALPKVRMYSIHVCISISTPGTGTDENENEADDLSPFFKKMSEMPMAMNLEAGTNTDCPRRRHYGRLESSECETA